MAAASAGAELPKVELLRHRAREELTRLLNTNKEPKDLVLDPELIRPLDRIAGAALLKQHGVDKIFKLEAGKTLGGCDRRIYLVRPHPHLARHIADQINTERRNGNQQRSYQIVFVPRKTHICEVTLENEGVLGYATVGEFPLDLIPLNKDLLSLELPQFYRSVYLDGDQMWLHTVARSLVNIQQCFGSFINVHCIGRCAKMVYELTKFMTELPAEGLNSEIGHLFLVDRDCDYVTPLCSQVAYEGLLDDTFRIQSGSVEFGPSVVGRDQAAKLLISSGDMVYEAIRNRHFCDVSSYLSVKAKTLQSDYNKRHNLDLAAMKEFVAVDLKELTVQHKSLSLHVEACEYINKVKMKMDFEEQLRVEHSLLEGIDIKDCTNYIEELINKQSSMLDVLRLWCMLSVTQGGLPTQTQRSLKTQFVHSYGFDKLLLLENLQRVGLLTESTDQQSATKFTEEMALNVPLPCSFRSLSRKLNLIPKSAEEINLRTPNDISYVFSGAYRPLLCRIIEKILLADGSVSWDELVKLLPVPMFAECRAKSARIGAATSSSRIALVYFIGGCTYSEVIALRYLAQKNDYKILIATTSTGNNMSLIEGCMT